MTHRPISISASVVFLQLLFLSRIIVERLYLRVLVCVCVRVRVSVCVSVC